MNTLKAIRKSRFVAFLVSGLVAFYIGLMRVFMRLETPYLNDFEKAQALGKGVIVVFWHQRLLLSPVAARFSPVQIHMLSSTSRDGEIMARGAGAGGVHFIRGSSANVKKTFKDKKGAPALLQMIAALRDGDVVAITPDGPRGPAHEAQMGVIRLAERTGAPILPIGLSAASGWHIIKTWDFAYLANPFAKKACVTVPALLVPSGATPEILEEKRCLLEGQLNEVTLRADKKVGKITPTRHSKME